MKRIDTNDSALSPSQWLKCRPMKTYTYYTHLRDSGAVVSRAVALPDSDSRKQSCNIWRHKAVAAGAILQAGTGRQIEQQRANDLFTGRAAAPHAQGLSADRAAKANGAAPDGGAE